MHDTTYEALRHMSRKFLHHRHRPPALDTTGLVHETYFRIHDAEQKAAWASPGHRFATYASMMRSAFVDYARAWQAEKRGGRVQHRSLALISNEGAFAQHADDSAAFILDLNTALDRLGPDRATHKAIAEARLFGGLGLAETAAALNLPERTVGRYWRWIKHYLHGELLADSAESVSSHSRSTR
ncbi:MAG: ECF-type sigma factor [Bacteroidota bacterium]